MKHFKRFLCLMLCAVLLVCVVPVSEGASTLKVTDRTKTYSLTVGDTFTYTFWLNLSKDLLNYTSDVINELAPDSATYTTALKKANVTKISGYVHYDTSKLELVKVEQPNSSGLVTRYIETKELDTGTSFDGCVLDISRDGFFFNCKQKTAEEQKVFINQTQVLLRATFKVKKSGTCDMRTKLSRIKLSAIFNEVEKEFDMVEYGKVYFPFKSYETINKESPSTCLPALVGDQGFDVRCINEARDIEDGRYYHVSKGTVVCMQGVSVSKKKTVVTATKLTAKVKEDGVVWFYDVPYGLYYVNGSWINPDTGTIYQTKDLAHAEYVAVPATGEVQALWFFAGSYADLATPKLTSVTNTSSGIQIKWKSVEDAQRYCVLRGVGDGGYEKIGTTTGTSYTDKNVTSGKTYTYTVCCMDKNGTNYKSSYNKTGLTIKYIASPKISVSARSSGGVTVSWKKISGASGYYVYRKLKTDSSWTKLATVKDDLTYVDTTVKNGKNYQFSVIAYSGKYKSLRSNVITQVYLTKPTVEKATSPSVGSLKVIWTENTKADGYQIRYTKDGIYTTKSVSGSDNLKLTVGSLTKKAEYEVSVRCYKTVNGVKYYSAWSKSASVTIRSK